MLDKYIYLEGTVRTVTLGIQKPFGAYNKQKDY